MKTTQVRLPGIAIPGRWPIETRTNMALARDQDTGSAIKIMGPDLQVLSDSGPKAFRISRALGLPAQQPALWESAHSGGYYIDIDS